MGCGSWSSPRSTIQTSSRGPCWRRSAVESSPDGPRSKRSRVRSPDAPPCSLLDNCEHVVAAAANVASELLSGSQTLSILATSHEQLGVAGEVTFTVPSLSIDTEALELFVDRAAKARPGFAPHQPRMPRRSERSANASTACRSHSKLAAARHPARSAPSRSARGCRIGSGCCRQGAPDSDASASRRCGARSTGATTCSTDDERAALRRLSVFVGRLRSRRGAGRSSPTIGSTHIDVTDLVGSLVDKSLVIVDDRRRRRSVPACWRPIREYGAERLDESGERSDVALRHRSHYPDVARAARLGRGGRARTRRSGGARVIAEMDNIRAALNSRRSTTAMAPR